MTRGGETLGPYEIALGARVEVRAPGGTVFVPRGRKDAGVLALLALSPGHRRTRAWLQDHLWSDKQQAQAGASLRRALSNLRAELGDHRSLLGADMRAIWLEGSTKVTLDGAIAEEDFLSELAIDDPEFEQWLRDAMAARTRTQAPPDRAPMPPGFPTRIRLIGTGGTGKDLQNLLLDALSERFAILGPIAVERETTGMPAEPETGDKPDLVLELETHREEVAVRVQLRLLTGSTRHFLWVGRGTFPAEQVLAAESAEIAAFLNTAVAATIERSFARFRGSQFFQLQHAASLLFTGQLRDLESAETMLKALDVDGPGRPVVHAWRGFQRLTEYLEFGGDANRLIGEANEFASEALKHGQTNPLALALVAQIEMKLNGDPERAEYLAERALAFSGDNAYALAAAGHAATLLGRFQESYDLSKAAAEAASGLPNSFIWDMQRSLAALAVSKRGEALEFAKKSHLGMASYRPALRYLVALSALEGRREEVEKYAKKLQRIEPGFSVSNLMQPDYPLDTFRALGLDTEL